MSQTMWYQDGPPTGNWPPGREPRRITAIGAAENEPMGIFLGSESMNALDLAISKSSDRSVTGLLLGYPLQSDRRPFLLVTDILWHPDHLSKEDLKEEDALLTDSSLELLETLWIKHHADKTIVGWFHAFSGRADHEITPYARHTHERFFNSAWQISLLIDSEHNTSQLYRWHDDILISCESFYFWNSVSEPVTTLIVEPTVSPLPIEQHLPKSDDAEAHDTSIANLRKPWLVAPLLMALFYLLIPAAPGSIPWVKVQQSNYRRELVLLRGELITLEEEAAHLKRLTTTVEANVRETITGVLNAPSSSGTPEESISTADTTPTVADDNDTGMPPSENERESRREYIIQVGDTMWSISGDLLGNPYQFPSLAQENDISDPDRIYPGQRLRLP